MAFKNHRRQGYAPLTITVSSDGVESETLGKGKITSHVVSFTGAMAEQETPLYGGDGVEQVESNEEGSVQLVLTQLDLEDEAAFGGHAYSAETGMTVKDGDEAPYMRYAALGTGSRVNDSTGKRETFFRLIKYYRVKMGPVTDAFKVKENTVAWQTHSCAGHCYKNAEGVQVVKTDFATFELALADMKVFLNVSEV